MLTITDTKNRVLNHALDNLATAVAWIGPQLEVLAANAPARALLAKLDDLGHRNSQLARAVGAGNSPLSREEEKHVRGILGAMDLPARRTRIEICGLMLDLGIAPVRGERGEWAGWLVDANVVERAHRAHGVYGLPFPAMRVDSDGLICEINSAAMELLQLAREHFPVAPENATGQQLLTFFGQPGTQLTRLWEGRPLEFQAGKMQYKAAVAPFFACDGKYDGAIVAISTAWPARPAIAMEQLEAHFQSLIDEALATVAQAGRLEAEEAAGHAPAEAEPARAPELAPL